MSKASLASFIFGFAAGAAVAVLCVRRKYAAIAQEEIDSVKDVFTVRHTETSEQEERKEYESMAKIYSTENETRKDDGMKDKPYVISPDEFGEKEDYDTISLTYYADDVLTDDNNDVVNNISGTVGEDFHTHFGEYEDDSVFIRNDTLKCDYEVLRDMRSWEQLNE